MAKPAGPLLTLYSAFAIAWAAYAAWALLALSNGQTRIYAEYGLLETTQVILLSAACIAFIVTLSRNGRYNTLLMLSCALLCYSFIVRELDVEDFDLPPAVITLTSGTGRNILLAVAFCALLAYALYVDFRHYLKEALQFAVTPAGMMLVAAGLLLYLAAFFEGYQGVEHPAFCEELTEVTAYTLILLSSLTSSLTHKTTCQIQKSQ
ncbi:hypothetical protein QGM61_07990 [Pseudohongiella sp. SYSU M77423]|uniref:hypothetical protein n=1 Tax=Pseudohongiella sp. SYSU M77423 TaxID=3042312 RepID=UPI00247FC67D|nr:hypothetical protein [Pseudohongiella sp. SYSU M77423]MDH7943760.1 hypothetical protein [Pseudohongiella sp. SYSU M77423]